MTLPEIEEAIWKLLGQLDFRRTLRKVVEFGDLLNMALERKGMEEYQKWVVRFNLGTRSEQLYRQGANLCAENPKYLDRFGTLNGLLTFVRRASRAGRREARRIAREEAIRNAGPADGRFRVECADCRSYEWPEAVDVIATDPPWADLDLYRWLGRFAFTHLRPGGVALVQCGHAQLADVLSILTPAGLRYNWTLAYYYALPMNLSGLPLAQSWRMVLLLSRGKWDTRGLQTTSDLITAGKNDQEFHRWQQPTKPWSEWLRALTRPGELIVDPCIGSGTVACAAKLAGGRRFLGTDIDAENVQTAQARINDTKE